MVAHVDSITIKSLSGIVMRQTGASDGGNLHTAGADVVCTCTYIDIAYRIQFKVVTPVNQTVDDS